MDILEEGVTISDLSVRVALIGGKLRGMSVYCGFGPSRAFSQIKG
jgi:hypothetical protein